MRSTLAVASVVVFLALIARASADVEKVCEQPDVMKQIIERVNMIPSFKARGFQAIDMVDPVTEAFDDKTDDLTCTFLAKWSDLSEQRVRVSVTKNSIGQTVVKVVPVAGAR